MKTHPESDAADGGMEHELEPVASPPANDNAEPVGWGTTTVELRPKQAREIEQMRVLAGQLLEIASRLQRELFTPEVRKRVRDRKRDVSAEAVAKQVQLMRKQGVL
jgi:hypothetical protein